MFEPAVKELVEAKNRGDKQKSFTRVNISLTREAYVWARKPFFYNSIKRIKRKRFLSLRNPA